MHKSDDGISDDETLKKEEIKPTPKPFYPSHGWLAPIAGFGATVVFRVISFGMKDQTSEVIRLVQSIGGLLFLAFIIFGFIQSFRCLKRGHKNYGIVGIIVNSLVVLLMCGAIIFAIVQASNPKPIIAQMCRQVKTQLPVTVDEVTTLIRVHQDPENVINYTYRLKLVDGVVIGKEGWDQQEATIRTMVLSKHPFKELEGKGAKVKYIYTDQNGITLHSYTVDLDAIKTK